MIVALPLTDSGEFSSHFGAATQAGLFTVDVAKRRIEKAAAVVPPSPEPCGWADWLGARGVKVFLAGGIGQGALQRMNAAGIEVIPGVSPGLPALLVQSWINGTLRAGTNVCQGAQAHHEHGHHESHAASDDCCCTR